MAGKVEAAKGQPDCCPPLEPCDVCDTLDFRFRLPFRPLVDAAGQRRTIPVEVVLHFRLTRCSGPLSLGDLLYSTTLLPGEKVRLFTSDRHSRFTYDSETNLSYYNHTTSEESFFMAGMANAVNNVSVNEDAASTSSFHSSAVSGGGGLGIDLGFVSLGGSVSGGSYDASSASTFARNLTQHADSSSRHVEVGTRAASSTQVGEVSTRAHTETDSEDQYEASSREFTNPNRCHALTFQFYKLNKCQTLRWELVGIERHVLDSAAPTGIQLNDPAPTGQVGVIPNSVLATAADRLDVEARARTSAAQSAGTTVADARFAVAGFAAPTAVAVEPLQAAAREAALKAVDEDLVAEGLIAAVGGDVSPDAQKRLGWERQVALPTAGVIVKGCLDECDVCEPALDRAIELELEHKRLENELLKKQIALLEKSQEYRCCPSVDDDDGGAP
ncbi:MAG TPA: hypothetical protein VFA19_13450 [Gaiellaceae bacterium]|nr:hypothetical protein [Gaiellaceae bacterium]